jgi:hypothetical protein
MGTGRSVLAAGRPSDGGTSTAARAVKASTVSRTHRRTAGGTSGAAAPGAPATVSDESAKL